MAFSPHFSWEGWVLSSIEKVSEPVIKGAALLEFSFINFQMSFSQRSSFEILSLLKTFSPNSPLEFRGVWRDSYSVVFFLLQKKFENLSLV